MVINQMSHMIDILEGDLAYAAPIFEKTIYARNCLISAVNALDPKRIDSLSE